VDRHGAAGCSVDSIAQARAYTNTHTPPLPCPLTFWTGAYIDEAQQQELDAYHAAVKARAESKENLSMG